MTITEHERIWNCVFRRLIHKPIFKDYKLCHLFVYCVLKARPSDKVKKIDHKDIMVKRGTLRVGRKAIAKSTGLNVNFVQRGVKRLAKLKMISVSIEPPITTTQLITICNYDKYFIEISQTDHPPDHPNEKKNIEANKKPITPLIDEPITTPSNVTNGNEREIQDVKNTTDHPDDRQTDHHSSVHVTRGEKKPITPPLPLLARTGTKSRAQIPSEDYYKKIKSFKHPLNQAPKPNAHTLIEQEKKEEGEKDFLKDFYEAMGNYPGECFNESKAERQFLKSVRTLYDLNDFQVACKNVRKFADSQGTQYLPHFENWMYNWKRWKIWKEIEATRIKKFNPAKENNNNWDEIINMTSDD